MNPTSRGRRSESIRAAGQLHSAATSVRYGTLPSRTRFWAVRTGGTYRGVFAIRDARALIAASAASQFGNWLFNAALLAFVYSETQSAAWVGAATICRLVPYVVLGPVGGMIADRYDRRSVLIVGDVLRCIIMLGLAAIVAVNGPVVVVIALTAAASLAGTAERPASIALLPRLVGESRLGPANALLHTVQDLGVVTGPAVGALLLAMSADWVAFGANAATFAGSATADLDDAHTRYAVQRALSRISWIAVEPRCANGADDTPRPHADARRRHGGAHVRRADSSARALCRATPRRRRRRIRLPARGGRAWRPAQHDFQRAPRRQHEGVVDRRGDRARVLPHSTRVRRRGDAPDRARRDRDRRRRVRRVRGRRRDRRGTRRRCRRPGARDGRVRCRSGRVDDWRRCARLCPRDDDITAHELDRTWSGRGGRHDLLSSRAARPRSAERGVAPRCSHLDLW